MTEEPRSRLSEGHRNRKKRLMKRPGGAGAALVWGWCGAWRPDTTR